MRVRARARFVLFLVARVGFVCACVRACVCVVFVLGCCCVFVFLHAWFKK